MKLKRRNTIKKWFVLKLLVFSLYVGWLFVYFLWGMNHLYLGLVEKPTREHQQLTSQIESARKQLANIPNFVIEREKQLVQAQKLLADEQSKVPTALNINNLVRNIIEEANECQVEAIPLRTTPHGTKVFGQYSYSYWNIFVSVEGNFQDITDFVENVDGKYMSTVTVVNVILDQSKKKPGGQDIPNHSGNVTGTLELVVYTRP